jgi:hypothetical protein
MNVGSAFNGGGVAGFGYPIGESSEIQVTIAGGLGEVDRGGPQFNLIPKTGGNTFSGTAFLSTAGKWSQGDNLTDELKGFGLTNVPALIKNWDTNVASAVRSSRTVCGSSTTSAATATSRRSRACSATATPATRPRGSTRGRQPAGARRGRQDDRSHSSDRAGHAATQGRLLSRLSEGLQRLGVRTRRGAVPRSR